MAEYEVQAVAALFAKLAARIGLDPEHPASEQRMQLELSELLDEDAEAAELARTLITFSRTRDACG
ncbi:MAG TPA: hypothetical protein VH025_07680 [Solirubrobacteraceae bacterium]|nr:hypothetical protein [Solirubrobacteraceae bacterium]